MYFLAVFYSVCHLCFTQKYVMVQKLDTVTILISMSYFVVVVTASKKEIVSPFYPHLTLVAKHYCCWSKPQMVFYYPWRLYGNHNLKLLDEVIKSNNPTVISKERTRAFVFIYLYVWFEAERLRGDSVLVSSSKLWFLFMCLLGNRPRHNRRLQSIVADTTQGSDRFSLHLHPADMNKCCLWTSATMWVSDHAGLPLLRWGERYCMWFGLYLCTLCYCVQRWRSC